MPADGRQYETCVERILDETWGQNSCVPLGFPPGIIGSPASHEHTGISHRPRRCYCCVGTVEGYRSDPNLSTQLAYSSDRSYTAPAPVHAKIFPQHVAQSAPLHNFSGWCRKTRNILLLYQVSLAPARFSFPLLCNYKVEETK